MFFHYHFRKGINPRLSSWKPYRARTQSNGLSCTEQVALAPLNPNCIEMKICNRVEYRCRLTKRVLGRWDSRRSYFGMGDSLIGSLLRPIVPLI